MSTMADIFYYKLFPTFRYTMQTKQRQNMTLSSEGDNDLF